MDNGKECLTGDSTKDDDYLVVKGGTSENPELGKIDIIAFALDADEVRYTIDTSPLNERIFICSLKKRKQSAKILNR